MAKTHKSALVLIPPQQAWPPIQAIRKRYDRNLRRWMPHITLLYPFRPWPEDSGVSRTLSEICEQAAPCRIALTALRWFRHARGKYTLWLQPEPAEPIRSLHARLLQAFPDCDETARFADGFVPHLSVGQAHGDARFQSLYPRLAGEWQPLEFTLDAVYWIWRRDPPDDVFRIGRRFPLSRNGGGKEISSTES